MATPKACFLIPYRKQNTNTHNQGGTRGIQKQYLTIGISEWLAAMNKPSKKRGVNSSEIIFKRLQARDDHSPAARALAASIREQGGNSNIITVAQIRDRELAIVCSTPLLAF